MVIHALRVDFEIPFLTRCSGIIWDPNLQLGGRFFFCTHFWLLNAGKGLLSYWKPRLFVSDPCILVSHFGKICYRDELKRQVFCFTGNQTFPAKPFGRLTI